MSEKLFEYAVTVRLHDTDAAGRLFFAHLFRHAHDAYEAFMCTIGFPLDRLIRNGKTLLPLTHAQADYHRPILHGDRMRVEVSVAELRRRSFAINYRFLNEQDEALASAHTVHVLMHNTPDNTPALPPTLHTALSNFLQ